MLAAVPEGDARDLLERAGAVYVCEPDDVTAMERILAARVLALDEGEPRRRAIARSWRSTSGETWRPGWRAPSTRSSAAALPSRSASAARPEGNDPWPKRRRSAAGAWLRSGECRIRPRRPLRGSRSRRAPSGLASATRRVAVLDHLRVPYRVEHEEREDERLVVVRRPAASVCWPSSDTLRGATAGFWRLGDTVVAGRLLSDAAADEILGAGWDPVEEIVQEDGSRAASLWRSCEGRMFLPFDPDEVVTNLWSEAYAELAGSAGSAVKAVMRRVYYRLRPVMPRALQLSLRRRAVRFQRQARFPRWPIEPSLHDILDLVLELLGDADDPVPWIAPWPKPYRWAVVLTHDVETGYGLDHLRCSAMSSSRRDFARLGTLYPAATPSRMT